MIIEHTLDQLHSSVTNRWYLQLFTVFTRSLLAIGFIPPSIPKILHRPFTVLPDTHPVGAYFNALYNTGYYYDFIGWTQLSAALLLLIPRTSHLGALMFLPIIVNIAVLTSSVGFKGTWLITILMSLAALYLVAWEYDRLKPILFSDRVARPKFQRWYYFAIPLFFAAGGFFGSLFFGWFLLGGDPWFWRRNLVLGGLGLAFGAAVALHYRFMPIGRLRESRPSP
ncbi:MAG TPA: hypothetical protein PKD26_08255 [Pyrinomonadaceae bacterium]|nr:hypothetical protein [Pyrinomonadaceae bacterium]